MRVATILAIIGALPFAGTLALIVISALERGAPRSGRGRPGRLSSRGGRATFPMRRGPDLHSARRPMAGQTPSGARVIGRC